ncbi:SseB family protein [Streptomyces sp. NEAU-H22]|uniref:SAV_915 family protein n=1 Tax=unclassified Streptomyces TaxID=2593676 RepID=UPI0022597C17|nr:MULTISPECIES: SAV_915 family protein [unclassified Streptomyces]MCX3285779.1 SseB family protein [Streptomyces sp. NEAU-H22]WMD03420.1 SseB family protein [Streptomyces sp. FXY-T5]
MPSTETTQIASEALVLPTMTEMPQGPDGAPLSDGAADVVLVPMAGEGGAEQLVALAFTSVPALVEAIGEKQPWVIIPTRQVRETLRGSGAAAVLIDPGPADGMEGRSSG